MAVKILNTIQEVRQFVNNQREISKKCIALIPTMGALHNGHLRLIHRAKEQSNIVIVSIFVNPLQFALNEDFKHYPRTIESDLKLIEDIADGVFIPTIEEMYKNSNDFSQIQICAGKIGEIYEGKDQPKKFGGMLTIVAKLFNIVQPNLAYFGQKDAQQLELIRKMVEELDYSIRIEPVETVRDNDGLALSSHNRFLNADERLEAVQLFDALKQAKIVAVNGGNLEDIKMAANNVFLTANILKLDYLEIVNPKTFQPISMESFQDNKENEEILIIVAAFLGKTRLIDNTLIQLKK